MTKEQELAKEAGFHLDGMPNMLFTVRGNHAQLERLIKLVRNAALTEAIDKARIFGLGLQIAQTERLIKALESLKEPTP